MFERVVTGLLLIIAIGFLTSLFVHPPAPGDVVGGMLPRFEGSESVLLAIRLIGFPVVVVLTLGPVLGVSFLAVQLAVFGVYMGATFAPNHKGMPLLPKDNSIDFLRRQVLTSRNIRGGRFVAWAMGGLNYQIEHHVFPRMASVNLRHVRPILVQFCAERDIPYTETGLVNSYRIVIRYLNRVGLSARDPFDCPAARSFRRA